MEKHKKTFIYYGLFLAVTTAIFAPIKGWQENSSYTWVIEPVAEAKESNEVEEIEEPIVYERDVLEEIVEEADSQQQEMEAIIAEVFKGEHYEKAMLLLKGNGEGSCAENKNLNPSALNDNTAWGGVGKDWGLFQINDYWQGIRHEGKAMQFLLDPEINARIAWRLYEDDGYSFKLWTCGRVHGI